MNMHAEKTSVAPKGGKNTAKKDNTKCALHFVDSRPVSFAQRKLQKGIQNSPRIAAQGENVGKLFGGAAQGRGGRPDRWPDIRSDRGAENPAAQAKLKNPFAKLSFDDSGITSILEHVTAYNKIGGYRFTFPLKERKEALTKLGEIERLIYAWFGEQRSPDLDTSPLNRAMKALMNGVLAERQALVALSVKNHDDAPPIADFDELPGYLREEITVLWNQLLAGEGILIEGVKEFKNKVLTDFSRLLETQMGRTLVGGIIQSGKGLVIRPTTREAGKYAAMPEDSEKEGLSLSEEIERFVPVDVTGMDEENRLRLLQHVRGANPESPGMSVTSERGTEHFSFGEGSGSSLPVPVDSEDAMPDASSRMADRYGNEVIAPTFINLGHELGHVLRSAQGISAGGEGGRRLLAHSFENPEASRPEEFFNIGGVENRLRKESGLRGRHGHGNLYSHWAVEGMTTVFQLIDEINRELETTGTESEEGIRLTGLLKRLNSLIAPFQSLMKGEGSIAELHDELARIRTDYYFG